MIKIKPAAIRSNEENAYLHGVLIKEIAEFKKEKDHAVIKDWLKFTFNIESTAALTTQEFEDLMENARQHVLKYWGLVIKKPNEI